jgi:hypothetical protein
MKTLKTLIALILFIMANNIYAQPVTLDSTFGENGMTKIPNTTEIRIIDFDNAGNIIAVGFTQEDEKEYLSIVKTNADGVIDQNFGIDGIITLEYPYLSTSQLALKITEANKIFITGVFLVTSVNENKRLFMQFNEDGSLDESFGDNGKIVLEKTEISVEAVNIENNNFVLMALLKINALTIKAFNRHLRCDTIFAFFCFMCCYEQIVKLKLLIINLKINY